MRRFLLNRKQQIGQVELIAELVVYASVDAKYLRGRHVMHWIDNASAVAASVHGYSSAIDSSRIVHALHATLGGLGADVWFEYIRTDANVADEPSRVDLSRVAHAFGAWPEAGLPPLMLSLPVEARVPPAGEWNAGAAVWMSAAAARRSQSCA